MHEQQLFQWIFISILVVTFAISGAFRRRARQLGGTIPRAQEGRFILGLRFLLSAPLYLSLLAYMINPNWMAWSMVSLPIWLRWLGVGVGLAMLPLLYWLLRSIGNNISETFLTKDNHALVTHGPYRWVRHPLYTVATVIFVALSLVAANWFMLAMAALLIFMITFFVIPKEETQLALKFGDAYRRYQQRTGKLFPHLSPSR